VLVLLSSASQANLAEYMTILGIYVHAWFLVFAVGLPYVVLVFEWVGIRHRDAVYLTAARKTSYVWGISFAAGAATGTLVEFGLVQVWSGSLAAIGTYMFSVLFLELFAFMTEVVFVVLYIYTWDRYAYRWVHWLFGLIVLLGSNVSAFMILGANSFMNVPWGTGTLLDSVLPWEKVAYGPQVSNLSALLALAAALSTKGSSALTNVTLGNSLGRILTSPLVILSDPDLPATFLHTVDAAIIVMSFEVSSVLAYLYFRGDPNRRKEFLGLFRKSFGVAAVASILQPLFGDMAGRVEYAYQYTKFLAAEGFPPQGGQNPVLGILLKGNPTYFFPGFSTLLAETSSSVIPSAARATVLGAEEAEPLIFPLYYGMIISGIVLFILALVYFASFSARLAGILEGFFSSLGLGVEKFLLLSSFAGVIISMFAGGAGWAVREVGRHPWTVYGLIPYYDVVTPAPITPAFVAAIMLLELLIFVVGTAAILWLVRSQVEDFLEAKSE